MATFTALVRGFLLFVGGVLSAAGSSHLILHLNSIQVILLPVDILRSLLTSLTIG